MSDRDKKIIIVLLIVAVIALPYVFYIKDKKVETETLRVEITSLEERYNYLHDLDLNRETYLREIDEMHAERDEIVASFPADIRRENYAMFLLQTEYSSDVITDEETGDVVGLEFPIVFDTASFGVNIMTPISTDYMGGNVELNSAEPMDTDFVAITNTSALTYNCYYGGMKYLLQYLMDYEDPMIYTQIDMAMDPETGIVSGAITLAQYAIAGPDRELDPVDFTIHVGKDDLNLSLDKMEMRGNEEDGIFGPITVTEVEEETPVEAGEETPIE